MYIDTHCHLSNNDYGNIDEVIKENRENGVDMIIVSGCDLESIKESIDLSSKYEDLYLTIGFHPSEADIITDKELIYLEELINSNREKIVGIGEIGLDYHYGKENIEKQKELFERQMQLANKLKMPVVIHSRDATLDTISILKKYPEVKGDIHCFSGSVEIAFEYIKMGYVLGIGGVLTFKNSNLFKVLEAIGINNIVLETDSPYLSPEPVRGKINSSKNLVYIAKKVSEILNLELEVVAQKTSINALSLFDLQ